MLLLLLLLCGTRCGDACSRKEHNKGKQLAALDETVRLHWESLHAFRSSGPAGTDLYEYYNRMNPDLLMEVAREYLGEVGPPPCSTSHWRSAVPVCVFCGECCAVCAGGVVS